MWSLNAWDYSVIIGYMGVLLILGIALERIASRSLDDYFIGGRRLPWWALGVSGMAYFLDMTGTMIITSFLFLLGPRGMFIEFRGGVCLGLAFMMLWAGKWHRRSKCLTGAEWMVFRFGDGPGGRFAQGISALSGIVGTIGGVALLIKGSGLFLTLFFPYSPLVCTLVMIGIATVYTMISGFYGVVFTDLFQSAIIIVSAIIITVLAVTRIAGVEDFGAIAVQVTGNAEWMSTVPSWKTTMPAGYEQYEMLMMFIFFYLLRALTGITGGSTVDQRYLGARSDRECGLLTLFWTTLMTVRWPMMIAFTVLGIFLVHDEFPDRSVTAQTAEMIKAEMPGITKEQWADKLSDIANHPENYPELATGLQALLGATEWNKKLLLVGYEGNVDPERILPAVLLFYIPPGLRGLMLIGLLAAAMSTFNAMVNGATGLITRDVYQKYIRPRAKTRELIYVSWMVVVLIVGASFLFAYTAQNVNDLWGWIVMGLGTGLVIPGLLRLLWWRFNGGGFALGIFAGMTAAILQRYFQPQMDERLQFLLLFAVGLTGSIAGTYMTRPGNDAVVERFYRITRPFGFWGPYKKRLSEEERAAMNKEHFRDIMASPFAQLWQVCLFLLPMQAVIGSWRAFAVTLALWVLGAVGMYWFWYRFLPQENYFEPGIEAGVKLEQETIRNQGDSNVKTAIV